MTDARNAKAIIVKRPEITRASTRSFGGGGGGGGRGGGGGGCNIKREVLYKMNHLTVNTAVDVSTHWAR